MASAATCINCDHGCPAVFCSECDGFYCQSCASAHTIMKLTRDHKTTSVDVPQAKAACITCTVHKQQPMDILCKECNKLICKKCALLKHKGHWCQQLVDAANEAKRELVYLVAETAEYITRQHEKLAEHKQVKEDVETNIEAAKTSVKNVATKMRDTIDSYEGHLLSDLDDYKAEVLTVLESHDKQTKSNKVMASKFKQDATSLCSSGSDVDQVMKTLTMQKKFDAMKGSKQQKVIWKVEPSVRLERYDSLIKMFGSVNLHHGSSLTPQDKIRLGEHLNQVPLACNEGCPGVTGMVVFSNILCVTRIGSGDLQLFDMRSGQNKTCQVPGMSNPQGMALVSSAIRTVVITDSHGTLHFVKLSTDLNIAYHQVKGHFISWARVSVSEQTRELLIGNGSQLAICSKEGDVLRQVTLNVPAPSRGSSNCRANSECYCVTGAKDGYAALIQGTHRTVIQWVDQDGKCGHTYGDTGIHLIGHGKHMVSDSKGRLIVVDNLYHKLHLVDSSAQFSQVLLTQDDGIKQPDCVFLDEASARLYVAHRGSEFAEVRVYRWPLSGEVQNTHFNLKLNLCQFVIKC